MRENVRDVGGVSAKTPQRYRAVRDKFLTFCKSRQITHCQQINKPLLLSYAAWLDGENYAYATEYLELTTLKQLVKFLIDEGHLPQTSLIKLPLSKPNDTDTYCYRIEEVTAILAHCQAQPELQWLRWALQRDDKPRLFRFQFLFFVTSRPVGTKSPGTSPNAI